MSVSFGSRAVDLGLIGGLLVAAGVNGLLARGAPGSSFYSIPMNVWSVAMVGFAIWRAVEIYH